MDITTHVGKRIKLYRNAAGLSLDKLAKKIYRSKSTVSKYERGLISIDIATLYEIATVLQINIEQLIDFSDSTVDNNKNNIIKINQRYMYEYKSNTNTIIRSVLRLTYKNSNINTLLFYGIKSYEDYEFCKNIYYGEAHISPSIQNYYLYNQNNKLEHVMITTISPINQQVNPIGMMLGLSSIPIEPVVCKVVISDEILSDNDVKDMLLFNKSEIQRLKKTNRLSIML